MEPAVRSTCLVLYSAQLGFGLPSIGGKDSPCPEHLMHIDVPPTLVSFAVDVATEKDIVTPELKKAGDKLVCACRSRQDEYDVPDL